ncbi:Nucleoporin Nup120/160 family-containing protein [Strongyloides ratti]|uniref:Nucleoporin Nup120/160 family-containing protein n=1 Tax=Strongyloides ratti TaxID=34506 RepID=A0A090LGN8_STRRB|nr:Nucleoporin Nup120/160 family-containing protein [Strongyloides ratti]CEF67278.1 Nucleoporin Nup120/160 family-containing protein [Strongyloides ratti]
MYEFSSTEFKFPSSEFAKFPQVKKIPIDISNISAQNADVDNYCNSFAFPNMGTVLDNRFIVWRSEGSNLYIQEYSTERDLQNASLCINVAPSVIIPGTQISFAKNFLTLTIPTQFAVCTLDLSLSEDMVDDLGCTSVLNFYDISSEHVLRRVYNLKSQESFAVRACVASPSGFSPHVVVCLNVKNEAIVIKIPKAGVPNVKVEEINLSSTGFLEYFSRTTENKKVVDFHAISTSEDTYLVTLHNESMIKLWSTNSCAVIDRVNICEFFETSLSSINNIYIKTATLNKEKFAVVFARSICEKSFIGLFSISADGFDFCCQSFITSKSLDHQDFIVMPAGKTFDLGVNLFILSRKPNNYKVDESIPIRQPYIIEKCWINTKSPRETAETISVIPVVNTYDVPFLKDIIMEDDSSEQTAFYKKKAVAINCKMNKKDVPLGDYLSLRSLIKSYVKSPKFKQTAMGTPGQKRMFDNLVSHSMDAALLNFWKKLLQTCYELQYVVNEAIGLWKAESLGLVGAILNNQITVISDGDYALTKIVTTVLEKSDLKSMPFIQLANNIEKQKKETLHDELLQSLNLLTFEPSKLTSVVSTSTYIGSSFTVDFLSCVLRNLIGGRTYFASRLLDIYKSIPKCQGNKTVQENEAIKKQLDQMKNLYGVLFQTLTLPLRIGGKSHSPSTTLSTSFFKYIQKYKPTLMMKPMVFSELQPFTLYLNNVIYATIYSMYPVSLSPVFLKYFIATDKFEYLVDFVGKCNNQAPELKYSNLLCNGLAYVASDGLKTKDVALNNLLNQLLPGTEHGENLTHIEALELLINYFMSKNQHEIAIQLGKYATEGIEVPAERLSSVYSLLFSVYLRKGDFLSALECLRNISNTEDRSKSLRLIVGILMEPKNRPSFISLTTGHICLAIMEYLEERANDCDDLMLAGDNFLFNVAFMAKRTKYLRAAYNMYHYACKLGQSIDSWQQLQRRCKALSEAKHLLSLSSEEKFLNIKSDLNIVYSRHCLNTHKITEEDIMKQLMLSEARLALMDIYQTNSLPPEDKETLERELINYNLFDMAWSIIMYFGTSPKRFFKTITEQCIIVEASGSDTPPEWVLHNIKNLKDCVEMEGRHYMILKCYLEQHLSVNPCDSEVLRVIFYEFLRYDFVAPEWFIKIFSTKNLPEYIRCLLEYNEIEKAYDALLPAIDKAIHDVGVHKKHNPIIPFITIQQFLYLANKGNFNKYSDKIESRVMEYFKKIKNVQIALKLH